MNGEAGILKNGLGIFSGKTEKKEMSESKAVETQTGEAKSEVAETSRFENKETRFARLKKSLRKRSAGIL